MISLSDTLFAAVGGRVEFIVNDRGAATEIVFHAVEEADEGQAQT